MIKITGLNDLFLTNKNLEEDGVWIDIDFEKKVKLRAFSAKIPMDIREELMKPHAALQRAGGKIDERLMEDIGLKVLAGGVIADWSGFSGIEGEGEDAKVVEVPYTSDTAYALLKELPHFAQFVMQIAMDRQMYKDAVREDGVKN